MPKTKTEEIIFGTVLREGVRESDLSGRIYDDGPDNHFVFRIQRIRKVTVVDGRGRNHQDSHTETETVDDLNLEQARFLAESLLRDITYAAETATRRVLYPAPKED